MSSTNEEIWLFNDFDCSLCHANQPDLFEPPRTDACRTCIKKLEDVQTKLVAETERRLRKEREKIGRGADVLAFKCRFCKVRFAEESMFAKNVCNGCWADMHSSPSTGSAKP